MSKRVNTVTNAQGGQSILNQVGDGESTDKRAEIENLPTKEGSGDNEQAQELAARAERARKETDEENRKDPGISGQGVRGPEDRSTSEVDADAQLGVDNGAAGEYRDHLAQARQDKPAPQAPAPTRPGKEVSKDLSIPTDAELAIAKTPIGKEKNPELAKVEAAKVEPKALGRHSTPDEVAHANLDELSKFFGTKKDDDLSRFHGIHPVHVQVVRELADRKKAGKSVHFSDGSRDILSQIHKKLVR